MAAVPARTVLDGELLVWDTHRGRCSFSLLQRRLTAGRKLPEIVRKYPAHLVAFELLRDGRGIELLEQPLTTRRAEPLRLLRGAPAPGTRGRAPCPLPPAWTAPSVGSGAIHDDEQRGARYPRPDECVGPPLPSSGTITECVIWRI